MKLYKLLVEEKKKLLDANFNIEILNENIKIVKDVRGLGLMLGIEIYGDSSIIQNKALEKGLLVLTAGKNVIRLLPPLNITMEDVKTGVDTLVSVLS